MFIKSLEVENWKCFLNKKYFKFNNHELIKMRNGTGKTSIFEAILYAIWGKAPVGFNLNTVRNDDTKPCRIFISFDIRIGGEIKEATIERVFGSSSPISELRIDDTLICESVRSIESYMGKIINQKISTQLWTNSLINSDITSNNFFKNSILDDILKDPLNLISIYKSKIYSHNKRINSFNENILDVGSIEIKLNSIKSKLKDRTNGDINKAKASEAAFNQIKILEEKIKDSDITLEEALYFNRIYFSKNRIQRDLKLEKSKKESIFSYFNKREIEKIIQASEQNNECVICGGTFDDRHKEELINEINLSGRSNQKIEKLEKDLKILEYDKTLVDSIIELNHQQSILDKCLNFKEIIESYNEENEKLWNEFSIVQKEYALALKQQEELKEINNLKAEVADFREKLQVLNNYVEDASAHYTNEIMTKASKYLSSINSRYKQISLYEGCFNVVVEDENFALKLLPVARLSNGEKTMCSLSLLFAVHNVIVPDLPLLFDETFAALDVENLEQIQKFLRNQDSQIFIITHDKNWEEF